MIPYNRNPKVVHETVIRDIVEIISDGIKHKDDYDDLVVWGKGSRHSFRSVSKATSNLTLTFPVLMSDTVDVENAIMISKSHERKCAAMMHMLFSALCVSGDEENVYDYLKQFHTNINFDGDNIDVDNFNDAMDNIADNIDESYIEDRRFKEWAYNLIQEDMKNINHTLSNDIISEHGIDDYRVVKYRGNRGECQILYPKDSIPIKEGALPEDDYTYAKQALDAYNDAHKTNYNMNTVFAFDHNGNNYNFTRPRISTSPEYNEIYDDFQKRKANAKQHNRSLNAPRDTTITKRTELDDLQKAEHRAHTMKLNTERLTNAFVKTDVAKANELLPTMMVIHFHTYASNEPVSAVIGIKAKLYRISGQEIMNRLIVRNKDNQGFHNFLRAATRETSFFKDFVFAVDKAKIDALSSSHRGSDSRIWKLLERRAIKSRIRRGMGTANDATAITSVVITQEEVETLKKEYNVDITRGAILKPIMEAYNLMGFMIIDANIETVKFWYDDGSNNFETLSFRSLERENGDQNYKKVINLMTKMVR